MAHLKKEDSTLVGLIQAGSGNSDDPLRVLLRHTIQEVLEEELTAFLNAEPYCRTEEWRGYRNGYKPRVLKTRVGRLELKERGLAGVRYVVSDDHRGLVDAIHRNFQGVIWHCCQVHFSRNVLGKVQKKDRQRVLALLREITGASCLESAQNRLCEAVNTLANTHRRYARSAWRRDARGVCLA